MFFVSLDRKFVAKKRNLLIFMMFLCLRRRHKRGGGNGRGKLGYFLAPPTPSPLTPATHSRLHAIHFAAIYHVTF